MADWLFIYKGSDLGRQDWRLGDTNIYERLTIHAVVMSVVTMIGIKKNGKTIIGVGGANPLLVHANLLGYHAQYYLVFTNLYVC